jgi:hypothetical protein
VPLPLASEQETVPLWPDAGRPLSIRSKSTANRLANEGKLPVRVIRVGHRFVVPTAELRELLGLDKPAAS